jgi:hypothetical protein
MLETLMAELIVKDTIESVYKVAFKEGRRQGYQEVINHLNQCRSDYGGYNGITVNDIDDLREVFLER